MDGKFSFEQRRILCSRRGEGKLGRKVSEMRVL